MKLKYKNGLLESLIVLFSKICSPRFRMSCVSPMLKPLSGEADEKEPRLYEIGGAYWVRAKGEGYIPA